MNQMTALFQCEGLPSGATMEVGQVAVKLCTDGTVVYIDEWEPRGGRTVLTPDGWHELAQHATALVREANAAWTSMRSN